MIKVIVADSSRACVYDTPSLGAQLSQSAAWINPAGHMREHDLVTDGPGRFANQGSYGTHTYDPHSSFRALSMQRFARMLGKSLDETIRADHCDGVVLIAAPRLLGEIKRALPRNARDKLVGEIPKDWIQYPPRVIAQQLRNARRERMFEH